MRNLFGSLNSTCCTPRKLRRLHALVVGKTVGEALALLSVQRRAGSRASIKLIKSVASQVTPSASGLALRVLKFDVGEGPKRRYFMPRAQGRAGQVLKRTSHLKIVLG